MDNKIIGFVGIDKYEILLYLSRILYHLNKKVLLADFSETRSLTESIPIPEVLCESNTYLDYRGIDFVKGQNYIFDMYRNYDYVLIDFGFNHEALSEIYCDHLIYITDLQLHHAKGLGRLKALGSPKSYIIIKDVFHCKVTPDIILSEIKLKTIIENIYIIEQDGLDIKFKIYSQYNQTFYFDKLSKSMKTFLKDILYQFDENFSKSYIQSAYKKAERGM